MKRRTIGFILALLLIIAALPITAVSTAQAAPSDATLAAAYGAYYEALRAAADEYGIGANAHHVDWAENVYRGVLHAELIHFGDSAIPQLLFIYDTGYGPEHYVVFLSVLGFTAGIEEYFGGHIGGHGNSIRVVIDRNSIYYLHNSYSGGFYDDEHDDPGYDEYFTVRNGRWVEVPEAEISINREHEFGGGADSVNAVLAQLQSLQTTPPTQPSAPSDWAVEEVNAAMEAGLVPNSIANAGWQRATSRLAAADAVVLLIEKASGKTMAEIAAERGWNLNANQFSDTNSQTVTFLKYAGVTTGIGNNRYDPDDDYNRAQIVTMLGRASEAFFGMEAQGTNPFSDVPDWAAPFVGFAAENGITQGVGGGRFDSNGVLQNQHTAVFSYRTFTVFTQAS